MPLRWCAVTVVDDQGHRHTIEVEAKSVYHAACLYFGRAAAPSPGARLPKTNADTVFEVRPIGEETVYTVGQRKMLAWANEEAASAAKKQRG
jgi:hypothetical protein